MSSKPSAICHLSKLKTHDLDAVYKHNLRLMQVPNASPNKRFSRIIGEENLTTRQLIDKRLANFNNIKIRKNAVIAFEIFLSASPAFFESESSHKADSFDVSNTKKWLALTKKFLTDKYGENLVELVAHMDERTPHLHAIVVPIYTKAIKIRRTKGQISKGINVEETVQPRLCGNEVVTKAYLRNLHTEYANSLSSLGIVRGVKKSRAKHEDIGDFYKIVNSTLAPSPLKISPPILSLPPTIGRKKKWLSEQQELINQAFEKLTKELSEQALRASSSANFNFKRWQQECERTAEFWLNFDSPKAAQNHIKNLKNQTIKLKTDHERSVSQLSLTNQNFEGENQKLKKENQKLKDLIDQLNSLLTPEQNNLTHNLKL